MVRVAVAKRRPSHDDVAVLKEQAGARVLQLRVERQRAAVAAVAGAGDAGVNSDRSAELLRAGGRINSVEPMKEAAVLLGSSQEGNRGARGVNHRRGRN